MNARTCFRSLAVFLLALFVVAGPLTAAAEFPERPIRLIAATGPGGSVDRTSRALASFWHETLGQPVLVENRKGGGGLVAWRRIMRAKPDGYTVIAHLSPSVNTMILRHKPKFGLDDIAFINLQWIDPTLILAHKDTGWKNIKDMVKAVKASPNKYSYSAASKFSPGAMMGPLLFRTLGLKVKIVPYSSGGTARAAVLGKHVTMSGGGAEGALVVEDSVNGLGIFWPKELKFWKGVRPINEQIKVYNKTVPNMASYRFFAVPAAVKKKYPDRFKKLVSSYKKLIKKNKGFKKFLKRSRIGRQWTGPKKATKIAHQVHKLAKKLFGKKKK